MAFIVVLFSIINFRVRTHRNIKFTFKLLPKGSRRLAVDVNDCIVLIYWSVSIIGGVLHPFFIVKKTVSLNVK